MPIKVQCPRDDCRKYMLLEDEDRGKSVLCLLCRRPLDVEGSGERQQPPRLPGAPASPSRVAAQERIVTCPQCSVQLRIDPGRKGRMKCPRCARIFVV